MCNDVLWRKRFCSFTRSHCNPMLCKTTKQNQSRQCPSVWTLPKSQMLLWEALHIFSSLASGSCYEQPCLKSVCDLRLYCCTNNSAFYTNNGAFLVIYIYINIDIYKYEVPSTPSPPPFSHSDCLKSKSSAKS